MTTIYISLLTETTALTIDSNVFAIDATAGAMTVTLPDIVSDGLNYKLIRIDSSSNIVTVDTVNSQLIDGVSSVILFGNSMMEFASLNGAWIKICNSSLLRSGPKSIYSTAFVGSVSGLLQFTASLLSSQFICSIPYTGSLQDPITKFSVVVSNALGNPVGNIYFKNVSGGSTIATIPYSSVSSTNNVLSTTSIANLPTGPSVIDMSIVFSSGSILDRLNVYSLIVQ